MKLTDRHRIAIQLYIDEQQISRGDFAKNFGVSEATISRWINGQIATIKHKNWVKLGTIVGNYLDKDASVALSEDSEIYDTWNKGSTTITTPEILTVELDRLSNDEKRLLTLFRSLPARSKNKILDVAVSETTGIIDQITR